MKKRSVLIYFALSLLFGISCLIPQSLGAHEEHSLHIVVVGDTGIGERGYHAGFEAVQQSMRRTGAEIILHLGDFVYQNELFPSHCNSAYLQTIRETLVRPYAVRVFVAGDNDLPPKPAKPKASGCWKGIARMATPFDEISTEGPAPRDLEGTMDLGPVLIAVINVFPWQDPTPWLKPRVEAARARGKWVIFALHVPPVTTAWYMKENQPILRQVNALGPDLVLSGNQHSYERFYPMGMPREDGTLPVLKQDRYRLGAGVTHIVSGGGGALFKPFADLQNRPEHSAPEPVRNALAVRSLMFHYLALDIGRDTMNIATYRVCTGPPKEGKNDPRWRPQNPVWRNVTLECDGKEPGTTLFDAVEILR